MNLMKFKSAEHYVYINTENIVGIEPALMDKGCTTIYTTGEKKFVVNGSCDEVADMVAGNKIKALDEDPPAYWYKKGIYPGWLYCSNCDEPWSFDTGAPPYCPCCGKKMVKKKEVVW